MYNVVVVSGEQQSVIHISTLFQMLFPYRPLQSIEQSSLCYTVGPYQISILYIVMSICQSQPFNLSLPLFPSVCVCVCVCVCAQLLSCVCLFVTPWTGAHQAPLSMKFSKQEYWRGLPSPSPGDLPPQGLNLGLLHHRQILHHLSYQGSPGNPKFFLHRRPLS